MKILILTTCLISFSTLAAEKNNSNQMKCEQVFEGGLNHPYISRCENTTEVCTIAYAGSNPDKSISCYPKPKQ